LFAEGRQWKLSHSLDDLIGTDDRMIRTTVSDVSMKRVINSQVKRDFVISLNTFKKPIKLVSQLFKKRHSCIPSFKKELMQKNYSETDG
jgi:hypothetical protein